MGLITVDDLVERRWARAWRGAGLILGLTLVVVVAAVAGWLLLRDGSGEFVAPSGGAQTASAAAPSAAEPTVASEQVRVVLGPGDTGPRVRGWQRALREVGLEVDVDGVFGPGTLEATRRFQASVGEEPTGEVTSRTLAAGRYASSLRQVGIFLLHDGELERVHRRVDETQLARGALEALVAAPLASERDEGLSTAIPRGATVVAVSVGDGTATVRLRGFAAATGAGDLQVRVDQVVRTLTLFDSVDDVRFVLPADDMAVFADAGIPLDRPRGEAGR
ncbi:MAG TPA: GerMN domain-containing protein [Euzebyales bacterium]|nr:GerMN domain-containing protein [Euzebyales bacterium]